MTNLANLVFCQSVLSLTLDDAKKAASSKATMHALLARVAETARPGGGSPKVLMAIAKLAEADWFYGELCVELAAGDERTTSITVYAEHGFGLRERVLPTVHFRVALDEFERAVRLAPSLAHPLRLHARDGVLLLAAHSPFDANLPTVRIDESSLIAATGSQEHAAKPSARAGTAKGSQESGVQTRPTVRRMVAIGPEARRSFHEK